MFKHGFVLSVISVYVASVLISSFCCIQEAYGATTAYPEICRIMEKYRSCSDLTFRIACPNSCDTSSACNGLPYVPTAGYCFGFPMSHTSLWSYAFEFCRAYGANSLSVVKSAADSANIATLVSASSLAEFHVGAISLGLDKQWMYLDGTIIGNDNNNWQGGFPSTTNDKPNCMHLREQNSYEQRNDECNWNHGYICALNPFP